MSIVVPPKLMAADRELTPEQLEEARSRWLPEILERAPHLLALRERTLPWTGGYSFAKLVETGLTASLTPVNRHVILELIVQHLSAIGMQQTADTIIEETGHKFQEKLQEWDKTDLMILVSLGVLPREDPWNIPEDPHVQYVVEPLEEDFFSSPYREDPRNPIDPSRDVVWIDKDGKKNYENIKASTLNYLVLQMFDPDTMAFMGSDGHLEEFFLALNTVTSSMHFFEHLQAVFDLKIGEEDAKSVEKRINLIQIEILKLIQKWVNFRGLFIGRRTLRAIHRFCDRFDSGYETLASLRRMISESMDKLTYGIRQNPKLEKEKPCIVDAQILFKPTLSLVEPEPIEVARQITLLSHAAFKAIPTRELIIALESKKSSLATPTLREFILFQKSIGLLCIEAIVYADDRVKAMERIVSIVKELGKIGNYQSLSAIVLHFLEPGAASLLQLGGDKTEIMKQLNADCGNEPASFDTYSYNLRERRFQAGQPGIPNLLKELEQAEITETEEFVDGLINWKRRRQFTEKMRLFYGFQNRPFPFHDVVQIQKHIKQGPIHTRERIFKKLKR